MAEKKKKPVFRGAKDGLDRASRVMVAGQGAYS